MADYPNYTPYHYVHQNPVNLIDPTGMAAEGIETHFVNEKGETIANTDDGSNEVIVIRKENEDKFTKELSEKVKTKDDLNSEVNKELGEKYGYNFKEHNRNVDGGKGENYYTEGDDDQQVQWNMGYHKGYNNESLDLDPRTTTIIPGSFSRSAGHARGARHREAGKMNAFQPELLNSKANNYIKTNQAPKVNYRRYSELPIPLLIEPLN